MEHSLNATEFEKIETIIGSGTSFEQQEYSFSHNNPPLGINYYRLKQVDFDGTSAFSEVSVITLTDDNFVSIAYPNPTSGQLTIRGSFDSNDNIQIFNALGYIVLDKVPIISRVDNSMQLDLSDLPAGFYHIKTIYENYMVSKFKLFR